MLKYVVNPDETFVSHSPSRSEEAFLGIYS
jgi:hypothetical protein